MIDQTELPKIVDIDERRDEILTKKGIEGARAWMEAWINEHRLDYTAAARQIGLGESGRTVLSAFIRHKLETEPPLRLVQAIQQFKVYQEGPEGITKVIGFRETGCSTAIWKQADSARNGHKLSSVIGLSGYGKTEALKQFQHRHHDDGRPPVRLITCNVLVNAPFLARKLALDMGLVERGCEPAMGLELVIKRLRSHPEFWIIDEANFLQERCLHVFRYIHDVTATGMLLAGTPVFMHMVANRAHSKNAVSGAEELDGPLALFADRIFTRVLPGISEDEVHEIAEDVLHAALSDGAHSKLTLLVNQNMRLLTRLLLQLHETKGKKTIKEITEGMVTDAWKQLAEGR